MRLLFLIALAAAPLLHAQAQIDGLLAPVSESAAPVSAQPEREGRWLDPLPGSAKSATTLDAAGLVAELEKQLCAQLNLDGELKLELARAWPAMKLPAPGWELQIADLPAGGLSPSFYVRVKITSGGQTMAEGQLPLRAQLWQDVWVAANRIERQQPLDRSLLATQKTDILRVSQPLIPASTDPSGLEANQGLATGHPLTKRDVSAKPVIRKGQVVEVTAAQGMLRMHSKALALENGAAGDLIKLRNLESRREINGQILNENEVQVHF